MAQENIGSAMEIYKVLTKKNATETQILDWYQCIKSKHAVEKREMQKAKAKAKKVR